MTKVCNNAFRICKAGGIAIFVIACLTMAITAHGEELPPAVAEALKTANIPARNVSAVVTQRRLGPSSHSPQCPPCDEPGLGHEIAHDLRRAGSTGPAHTWKTEALADAAPVQGRLEGNLYLRGSGDPRLALEQFSLFLRQLRARGVGHIQGDLVLDRSAFSLPPIQDPAKFDNEPLRPYNAGPDALLVNLKSLSFTLHPEPGSVAVLHETPGVDQQLINRLKLGDESCGDWREKLKVEQADDTIILRGIFPKSCGDKHLNLSPWPANLQVERLFRALWQELGGTLAGQAREGSAPSGAVLLATHESPSLGEIVREINKYSNNVMARQVFLTLDALRPATPEGAQRRINAWLNEKNLTMPELVLDNGSGLSRLERISAESLARLLHAAWAKPGHA